MEAYKQELTKRRKYRVLSQIGVEAHVLAGVGAWVFNIKILIYVPQILKKLKIVA